MKHKLCGVHGGNTGGADGQCYAMRRRRWRRFRGATVVAIAVAMTLETALSGCTVGPRYTRPDFPLADHFKEDASWHPAAVVVGEGPAPVKDSAPRPAGAVEAQWWTLWNDPVLDKLELEACENNQLLAAARANYARALELVSRSRASLYPNLSLGVEPMRSEELSYESSRERFTYYPETDLKVWLEASWEPDLWGKVRHGIEAALSGAASEAATRDGVKLSITAALAEHYLRVRESDSQLQLLGAEHDAYARIYAEVRAAQSQGLATEDDVLRANNAISAIERAVSEESAVRAVQEHAAAALVGSTPTGFSIAVDPDYKFALPEVAPVLPSALLERRPDIVAAERSVAQANARIGIAQSAYYPDLRLTAGVGGESSSLAELLTAPARIWSVGPAMALSLFDGGRTSAIVHVAQSEYTKAVADYRETVIQAMREVEDRLVKGLNDDRVAENAKQEWLRSRRLTDDQQRQQRAGLATSIALLHSEIATDEAKRRWRASVALASLNRIGLVKSIGGGWQGGQVSVTASD